MATDTKSLFGGRRNWLLHLILMSISALFLMPILWMLITSLKDNSQVFHSPPIFIPKPVKWDNYSEAFTVANFGRYMVNTVILAGLTIMGNLFSCTLVAYGFARIRWKGRDALFLLVLATMLLPQHVTIVPLFITYRKLGLIGGGYKGYLPLILPSWFGEAFFIFMVRQFFLGIPNELTDAARIDGCSELGILVRIIVPLSKPVLIAVAMFSMIRTWGDFFGQLIYLRDREFFTISVGLAQFQGRFMTQWNQAMAAAAMAVVPILIVFILAQRQFVQGISLTGLK